MASPIRFVFELSADEHGTIESTLKLATSEDAVALRALPSGGLVQVPQALFMETLRREAYTMAISMLSSGTQIEDVTVQAVDEAVRAHLLKMMDIHAKEAVQVALDQMTDHATNP